MSDKVIDTNTSVCQDNSEIKPTSSLPKLPRVWEVDALRGVLILLVVLDHFMYDILSLGRYFESEFWKAMYTASIDYRTGIGFLGAMREELLNGFIMCFVLLSGVSSSFSRCNWARGVKMAGFALVLTAVTHLIANITKSSGMVINFNVIHVIAICILFYSLLEWIQPKMMSKLAKNIFGWCVVGFIIIVMAVGYYYINTPHPDMSDKFGMIFFEHVTNFALSPADHLPLFPALAWFLMGAFVGKVLYPERTTLFPNACSAVVKPLTLCGSYSLWVYFGSQVVVYGVIYLFAVVLGVM